MNRYEAILDEERFPYKNMSLEERNFYLNIIRKCKDICDTENKVGNKSTCEIVELRLKKENNAVGFNGFLSIDNENRCIEGELFLQDKNTIMVDYKITRLSTTDEHKEYRVYDMFKLQNDVLKRSSVYNYDYKKTYEEVVEGKIR